MWVLIWKVDDFEHSHICTASEATLWSNICSYYVTVLPLCRYKREKEDPLPAAHSLHMVLNAVLSNFNTPLVDFQVPTILLHISVDDCMKLTKQNKGVMQLEHGFTIFFILKGDFIVKVVLMQILTTFNTGSILPAQALLATLNIILPMAYFSASIGSGDELSSYLKVLSCLVALKLNVQVSSLCCELQLLKV